MIVKRQSLASHQIISKLSWNYLQCLPNIATWNNVTNVEVPGHRGIAANEKVDALARNAPSANSVGPEPAFGLPNAVAHGFIKLRSHWKSVSKQITQ